MGKYGTNLEGFGAFEGGVNADKGAPLVSTSSDGETALLFGPAALREIQAGVANGDFAIPPDDASATITAENPLPYWTFTDVNSAGAITCAVVTDATAASTNVLRWSVAASTLTGKSATLTRNIPIASSQDRNFSYMLMAETKNGSATGGGTSPTLTMSLSFLKLDGTSTGSTVSSPTTPFTDQAGIGSVTVQRSINTCAPGDAAFMKVTVTCATGAGTSGTNTATLDVFETRLVVGQEYILISEGSTPSSFAPSIIYQELGVMYLLSSVKVYVNSDAQIAGNLEVGGTTQLNGANSLWVSRASVASATQSFTNNTAATVLLDTASTTPTTGTYDPKSWFNNANDRIAIGQAGFYAVTANIAFVANATGRRIVSINVNGTEVTSTTAMAAPTGSSILCATTNLYLASGDLVTMSALQTSGGALSTVVVAGAYPALSVGRIGG